LPGGKNNIYGDWTDKQAKGYLRRYFGYVTYVDDQITRVFDALKEKGEYENTIIVFSSDHGDMLCEQGLIYKHTFNGYDTLMKVPMLMQWIDGIPAGSVYSGLSSHVDIVPTLMELTGVECTSDTDGKSIAKSILNQGEEERDEIFIDVFNHGLVTRKGNWKFVLNAAVYDGEMIRKIDELYDLENDPNEINNLAFNDDQYERIEGLKGNIFEWLTKTRHPYAKQLREASELPQPI
jgi:arylsulfatase